jgi:hypothetical protein
LELLFGITICIGIDIGPKRPEFLDAEQLYRQPKFVVPDF